MLFLTIGTGIARFTLLIEFFGINLPAPDTFSVQGENIALIIFSESEFILGGFLSCVPAVRAWARSRWDPDMSMGESNSTPLEFDGKAADEERALGFLTELKGTEKEGR